jgi:hypothetical protein
MAWPSFVRYPVVRAYFAWHLLLRFQGYLNSVRIHGGVLSPADVWIDYLAGPCGGYDAPLSLRVEPQDITVLEQVDTPLTVLPDGFGPFAFRKVT